MPLSFQIPYCLGFSSFWVRVRKRYHCHRALHFLFVDCSEPALSFHTSVREPTHTHTPHTNIWIHYRPRKRKVFRTKLKIIFRRDISKYFFVAKKQYGIWNVCSRLRVLWSAFQDPPYVRYRQLTAKQTKYYNQSPRFCVSELRGKRQLLACR